MTLGKQYTWQAGDTFHTIACRYCRPHQYTELIDHNRVLLVKNSYLMRAGDVIEIPDSWFPIPTLEFTTKFRGSHGERTTV